MLQQILLHYLYSLMLTVMYFMNKRLQISHDLTTPCFGTLKSCHVAFEEERF